MNNDVILNSAVPQRIRQVPEVHPHLPALAIRRRQEIGVVRSRSGLHRNCDPISTSPAFVEVVVLEIEHGFGKSIFVGDVVNGVGNVKCIDTGSVHVVIGGWVRSRVLVVDEGEIGARLRSSIRLVAFERDNIVPTIKSLLGSWKISIEKGTYEVVVVVAAPSLCHP